MGKSVWNVTEELKTAHMTQVFSGGACNILDEHGSLLRNRERDAINNWLSEKDIFFFDPQIHPETHGVEYNYEEHSRLEMAAREAAKLNLYEISPRTFGGVSSLEIALDHVRWHEPMVLYYSDGDADADRIPDHNERGYPQFVPHGILKDEAANLAHLKEMSKNANHMRRYLLRFSLAVPELVIVFGGRHRRKDIEITPDQMHAADIFEAVVRAAAGEAVTVYFPRRHTPMDGFGNPVFAVPDDPKPMQQQILLDQYVQEGNKLRERIAELIKMKVFLRVAYTQRTAIMEMEELLRLRGLL